MSLALCVNPPSREKWGLNGRQYSVSPRLCFKFLPPNTFFSKSGLHEHFLDNFFTSLNMSILNEV